jgi:hypothetical protein
MRVHLLWEVPALVLFEVSITDSKLAQLKVVNLEKQRLHDKSLSIRLEGIFGRRIPRDP